MKEASATQCFNKLRTSSERLHERSFWTNPQSEVFVTWYPAAKSGRKMSPLMYRRQFFSKVCSAHVADDEMMLTCVWECTQPCLVHVPKKHNFGLWPNVCKIIRVTHVLTITKNGRRFLDLYELSLLRIFRINIHSDVATEGAPTIKDVSLKAVLTKTYFYASTKAIRIYKCSGIRQFLFAGKVMGQHATYIAQSQNNDTMTWRHSVLAYHSYFTNMNLKNNRPNKKLMGNFAYGYMFYKEFS